ncbi:XRE family transcriptional regulator [Zobellia roscoffensis]|uniref:helix-turn-helix domain-containing protein n=1 Tax=Zobellia roscoffensis TaxID=2779508 RepID=UPI00188A1BB3|nr:XRE family transcriptional regulator [Zobellia roscoffensis]
MSNMEYINVWIGSKIKDIRKSQNLKLGDLAEKSEVSIAMLSKIENGRVFATLPSLLQIFDALNINLSEFFTDLTVLNRFPGYVFKKRADYEYVDKEEGSQGFKYENILSHTIDKSSVNISLLTLEKNAKRETVTTDGFEYIHLIKGSIEYELGSDRFDMEEGDSLFFDGRIEHVPHNANKAEALLLVIYFIKLS